MKSCSVFKYVSTAKKVSRAALATKNIMKATYIILGFLVAPLKKKGTKKQVMLI